MDYAIHRGKDRSMSALRPVRLGVYFDQQLYAGGGYQQALNAALLVGQLSPQLVEATFFTNYRKNLRVFETFGIVAIYIHVSLFKRCLLLLRRRITHNKLLKIWQRFFGFNGFEKHFVNRGIDLVYFLSPNGMANDLEKLNYITTVWDLCHRDDMEFPEVRSDRVFEERERKYRSILPKAVAIFADSKIGKSNIIHRYGIDEERVHIMPFMPAQETLISSSEGSSEFTDVPSLYGLSIPYVFYPAQFWAHKNHVYILRGLKHLKEKHNIEMAAIFSGGDSGNRSFIEEQAGLMGINENVKYAGFVSGEELIELYKNAFALVMPTYFGPTNLPPLEAFSLGVPVLYSDKPGMREQVQHAALMIDLNSPESLADQLADLTWHPEKRESLVGKGKSLHLEYSNIDRLEIMTNILQGFQQKMVCWS